MGRWGGSPLHPRQVAAAGGRATVACRVEGSPVAEVRWYKDGAAILPHAHAHIMLQGRDTLVLTGVGERDAGVYQCVAANSVGEAQAASHLNIQGKVLTHSVTPHVTFSSSVSTLPSDLSFEHP